MNLGLPIYVVACKGTIEDIKDCLANGDDVNAKGDKGRTPLHYAAQDNTKEVVEFLIEQGAKVDAVDDEPPMTPLDYAVLAGRTEIVRCLAKNGANPGGARGDTIITAIAKGHTEIIKYFAELYPRLIEDTRLQNGMTLLFVAVSEDQIASMKCLVDLGADVNAKTNDGNTLLSFAENMGKTEATKWLRANGAR